MTTTSHIERQELLHTLGRHWNPSLTTMLASVNRPVESHTAGHYVHGEDGSTYLDWAGSYGVFLVGHRNPDVSAQVIEAFDAPPIIPGARHQSEQRLVDALTQHVLPTALTELRFGYSGAHIAECALQLVLTANGDRTKIVVVDGGYHGKTLGSVALLGGTHRVPFSDPGPCVVSVPPGDAAAFEAAVSRNDVAAAFVEPVLGGGNLRVPPRGWLTRVSQACAASGTVLVADEIQTGFGRTGTMLACEHEDVVPDVLLVSKALTGGHVPVAVMATSEELMSRARSSGQAWETAESSNEHLRYPAAAMAGAAAIEAVVGDGLVEHARTLGPRLCEGLTELARRHPKHVVDAPGIGLMAGLRMSNPAAESLLAMQMGLRGIHLGHSLNEDLNTPVLRFYPPLTVLPEHIDQVLKATEESLTWLDKRPPIVLRGITGLLRRQRSIPRRIVMALNHSPLSVTWE